MKRAMLFLAGYFLAATNAFADSADELIETAGVKGGLIVQVGCDDGSLTADLRVSSSYVVHGLDGDPANVARARQTIQARGVHGPVSVHLFDGVHLPYAENLVNLLIVVPEYNIPRLEVIRALVPGGVVITGGEKIIKPVPDEIDEWNCLLRLLGADEHHRRFQASCVRVLWCPKS